MTTRRTDEALTGVGIDDFLNRFDNEGDREMISAAVACLFTAACFALRSGIILRVGKDSTLLLRTLAMFFDDGDKKSDES